MMKYPIKKIIFSSITIIALLLIILGLISAWSFPDTDWTLGKGEKVNIRPGQPVVQKFMATKNNLKKIDLLFAASNNEPGGELEFKLYDESCSNLIEEKTSFIKSIDADDPYELKLQNAGQSKDRIFCLSIGFTETKGPVKNPYIFLVDNLRPENISLATNEEEIKGKSVAMRPAYQEDTLGKNIKRLNQRISQYKPWFLKANYLYFIAFGFILLSTATVLLLIMI